MAKYLLDSHTIIWYLSGDKQLSQTALSLIEDTNNEIVVSIASYWEISIKISINKLRLPVPLEDFIALAKEKSILTESLTEASVIGVKELSFHHKDPFDRIIVAHALSESIPIISKDVQLNAYAVERI